jgi:CBS domain-containing protein
MTKPALTVSGDMNVKYAIRLLARLGLSRALVVGDDGLLGLVTQRDLVLGHQEAGETPE